MDGLSLFGLGAVTAMLVFYAPEDRSPWFVLGFAASCALSSAYGFLQGAWPFGLVRAVWTLVALRRGRGARRVESGRRDQRTTTGVPTSTRSSGSTTSWLYMRMQP
jgi:hypothetical protein